MGKYTLTDIFEGDYRISQYFSARPEYYKQYGFAGHEGVDWATPVGVKILAPFDGIVRRDVDDPRGQAYGTHIVVEDPVQKCAVWYCHLSENYVKVGQQVKRGEVLGKTGNTGNSTGPHIHVGFVETDGKGSRQNLNNGYKGFLNILDSNLVSWKLGQSSHVETPPVYTDPHTDYEQIKAERNQLLAETEQLKTDKVLLQTQIDGWTKDNASLIERITELNKKIEGQDVALKDWEDFQNKIWVILNPIAKEKNQANILAEIQELIINEDNYEKDKKKMANLQKIYQSFISKAKQMTNISEIKEQAVLEAFLRLLGTKNTPKIEASSLSIAEKIFSFIKSKLKGGNTNG